MKRLIRYAPHVAGLLDAIRVTVGVTVTAH